MCDRTLDVHVRHIDFQQGDVCFVVRKLINMYLPVHLLFLAFEIMSVERNISLL